jgi:hypothetical protein
MASFGVAGSVSVAKSAGERMIAIWTHDDGTIIVFDPEIGTVCARSEHEAWQKIERRKALKQDRRAAPPL